MKLSELTLQAAENAGNIPYLFSAPNREDPSLLTTAENIYLSL
jgi:hypothetical protein